MEPKQVNLIIAGEGDYEEAKKSDWLKIMEASGISCQYTRASGHFDHDFLAGHIPAMRQLGVEFFVAMVGLKPDLPNVIAALDREVIIYAVPIPSSSLGILDPSSSVITNPTGTVIRCCGVGHRGLTNTALDIWKDLARTDLAMRRSYNAFMVAYKHAPKANVSVDTIFGSGA